MSNGNKTVNLVEICSGIVAKIINDASNLLRILEKAKTEDSSSTLGRSLARLKRIGANIWFHVEEPYLDKLFQTVKHAESLLDVALSLLCLEELPMR